MKENRLTSEKKNKNSIILNIGNDEGEIKNGAENASMAYIYIYSIIHQFAAWCLKHLGQCEILPG